MIARQSMKPGDSATDFKLATIAARCGFAHAAQLCNVFKKTFGLTPTEHRRQCQPWTTPLT